MKINSKVSPVFLNKLSTILTKFKENTTIQIGHEQVKALLNQYALRDILSPFLSRMDNSDQLSDRERKEYTKLYITIIDVYKEEILAESYYQKYLESLSRKNVGVSEAIGHICKNLLNCIPNAEQLYEYVSTIINIFHGHLQIARILKQVIETVDPIIMGEFQTQILIIIQQKIGSAKNKGQFMDTVLSLLLCLGGELSVHNQILNLLVKYLRNEDWNCRKVCVDICYALLDINGEINQNIHSIVKEMKYDKIKHVRESANNYEILYRQIFGDETTQKAQQKTNILSVIRQNNITEKPTLKTISKSPLKKNIQKQAKQQRNNDRSSSLDRSLKIKIKNQNFFKNAKNSDVIKVNQVRDSQNQPKYIPVQTVSKQIKIFDPPTIAKTQQSPHSQNNNNFETYLKKRIMINSPKNKSRAQQNKTQPSPQFQNINVLKIKNSSIKQPKFNYECELQNFKKKNKIVEVQSIKISTSNKDINSFPQGSFSKQQQLSMSLIQHNRDNQLLQEIKIMMFEFEKRVNDRLDRMERRLDVFQSKFEIIQSSVQISKRLDTVQGQDAMVMGRLQTNSPQSYFYNQSPNESKWDYSESSGIESNLQEKVKASIINQNWDEAFTLALTNNKKDILLILLQRCAFPTDKTVEECVLLQLRKLLDYTSALKWLKYFLIEKDLSHSRLLKLRQELLRRAGGNKNYEMMRQLVLNEIMEKLQSSEHT